MYDSTSAEPLFHAQRCPDDVITLDKVETLPSGKLITVMVKVVSLSETITIPGKNLQKQTATIADTTSSTCTYSLATTREHSDVAKSYKLMLSSPLTRENGN